MNNTKMLVSMRSNIALPQTFLTALSNKRYYPYSLDNLSQSGNLIPLVIVRCPATGVIRYQFCICKLFLKTTWLIFTEPQNSKICIKDTY